MPPMQWTLLASRARHELGGGSPPGAQLLTTVAWWMSILAMALSLVALVILLLDVAGVGEVGNRLVGGAR